MDFQKSKNWEWVTNANQILANLSQRPRVAFVNTEYFECGPLMPIRALFDIRTAQKIEELQKNLYYDILQSAEDVIPGSSIYLPKFLASNKKEFSNFKKQKLSFEEYLKNVTSLARNKETKKILSNFPELLGGDSRIVLKYGKRKNTCMNVRQSFKIPADIDPVFAKIVGSSNISLDYCKVIAIEGSIANVSEIHVLLERFSEKKVPCILICQNFSEEVSNTLAVNWLKENLMIIPLRYGNSLDNINLLSDISVVSGVVPISKNLGDSITVGCLDEERQGNLRNLKIYENFCLANTDLDIGYHVKDLIERMKKETIEDKVNILSERISNLSSNVLEISIYERNQTVYEELDACIKILNEFIKSGASQCFQTMPYSIYINCVERSQDLKNRISSIGGFLYQQ